MSRRIYRVVLKESVEKDTRRIPSVILKHILKRIFLLAHDPFPADTKKLHGYHRGYCIRIGQYRVVYEVTTEIRIVTIMRIGHRREVYRSL